jgi:hypothetical protein
MNYQQSKALFDALDDLETYAKMHTNELHKDDCDFKTLTRYKEYIDVAKCKVFNLAEEANDLRS